MKLGIAIAASKPMMATTIMISTSVKPVLLETLMLMQLFLSLTFRDRKTIIRMIDQCQGKM